MEHTAWIIHTGDDPPTGLSLYQILLCCTGLMLLLPGLQAVFASQQQLTLR